MALTPNEATALRIRLGQLLGESLAASDLPVAMDKLSAVLDAIPTVDHDALLAAAKDELTRQADHLVQQSVDLQRATAEIGTLRKSLADAQAQLAKKPAAAPAAAPTAPAKAADEPPAATK